MKLIDQNNLSIAITDLEGNKHLSGHGFTVEFRPTQNGVAAYVNGKWEAGLSSTDSIVISVPSELSGRDYVAVNNHSPFWCSPMFGNDFSQLPARVQELLTFDGEKWHCVLPVCADTFKTVLRGGEQGLEIVTYAHCVGLTACDHQLAFIYETGSEPFALLRSCAETAAKLLHNGLKMREEREVSDIFEHFGWCSWDALQVWVGEEGLTEKANEFKDKGVPVRFAIIDDMWGKAPHLDTAVKGMPFDDMVNIMHGSALDKFEGRDQFFPNGMSGAVDALHAAGIPHVGVWFPTTGYWNGFTHDGPDAKLLSDNLFLSQQRLWMSCEPPKGGTLIVKPTTEDTKAYFGELCGRVKSWGGDFVKIDNQGSYIYYKDTAPVGEAARNIQGAIDAVTGELFDGALINCMGMPSECMFNRPNSALSRCSDDFMPENREWFAKNILQCSYNGLLQGQYYVNDWDMWWTDDEQATKNSLCRAISGGPVYVSDKLGRTRAEVIKPLCYRDGRIPRCDISATPTADCLLGNPTTKESPFKIRNLVGKNGVVAMYNINKENKTVSGTVCPEDAGLCSGKYAYYEYFTGESGFLQSGEKISVTLENNDVLRLYTFAPAKDVTAMGRADMFVGIKAVTDEGNGAFTLYEGGKVSFISEKPIRVLCDGVELCAKRSGMLTTVECAPEQTCLKVELA